MPRKKSVKPAKRGRPPVNPPEMTERFMIRCSPADLEAWGAAALELGLTIGQWLRTLAHKAARAG